MLRSLSQFCAHCRPRQSGHVTLVAGRRGPLERLGPVRGRVGLGGGRAITSAFPAVYNYRAFLTVPAIGLIPGPNYTHLLSLNFLKLYWLICRMCACHCEDEVRSNLRWGFIPSVIWLAGQRATWGNVLANSATIWPTGPKNIDERPVETEHEAKSISQETTFAKDIDDGEALRQVLRRLSEQVGRRLRRKKLSGTTVKIKPRWADFTTVLAT
jgi:hypothetical protein